jgi:hypothetical protein
MRNLDQLRDARRRLPFLPFLIRLTDGREFWVPKAEQIAIGHKVAVLARDNDAFEFLEPSSIDSLNYDSNGKDKPRRRKS